MYVNPRKKKDGSVYFSFNYFDDAGKRIRLKTSEHPYFTRLEDAEQWARSQEAFRQSQKDMIARKLAWKDTFFDFPRLLKEYTEWQKVKAPNAWKNNVLHLTLYIFPWFLDKKKASNIHQWPALYRDFNAYLRNEAVKANGKGRIALSFGANIITSLNTFTTWMQQGIDPSINAVKCPSFPEHQLRQKSFDNVIQDVEYKVILHKLEAINQDSADMFALLYATGMRINEACSLPITALFKGRFEGSFDKELQQVGIPYVGYLVVESQSCERGVLRDPQTHKLIRKPLKGRKKIDHKHNRIIPIRTAAIWNMLAKRYKKQKELMETRVYGFDANNYLLFEGYNNKKLTADMTKVYENSAFSTKTAHDLRHSFATLFTGETRSFYLAKLILGHNSKAFERYLHIFESLSLEAKKNAQEIDEIG